MTIKSLKKFTVLFNRNEGGSLIPIIMIMVVMALMGGVFTSIMGVWKLSAPVTVNSKKASYLAETAATYALQDAKKRFFITNSSGTPLYPSETTGTRSAPYFVVNNGTETAQYWIERPYQSLNPDIDSNLGQNDDDITGDDDDIVDDDDDDGSKDPDMKRRYTIIATGKVKRVGVTDPIARSQVKVKATIEPLPIVEFGPGVYTEGAIQGNGAAGYDMWMDGLDVSTDPPSVAFNGTFPNSTFPPSDGSRAGIVYQPPGDTVPPVDAEIFEMMATEQGHYENGDFSAGNNYPNGSFYYSGSIPNVTYVTGDLSGSGNKIIYGVFYVEGDVSFGGNCQVQGLIFCNGNFTANGGGNKSPNLYGGVIQYGGGTIMRGNGNPVEIQISNTYFSAMRGMIPSINIVSWQESVSAN